MRLIPHTLVLASALCLLTACGGGSTTSGSSSSGSGSGGSGGSTTTVPPATETALLYTGAISGDPNYPVINLAFSLLDTNGAPIDLLDGGDFEIVTPAPDLENHYDLQKLAFQTNVTGGLALMLDISDSMALYFPEMQAAATKMVNDAVALGLYIDVYTFSTTGTVALLGSATTPATATTLNGFINGLTQQSITTYFFDAIAQTVAARLAAGVNTVSYGHNPTTVPLATADLMVIMSDALESPGTGGNSGAVTTAKAKQYQILSIPVGSSATTETNLKAISEFYVPAPNGLSSAVTDAMTFISNYFNGFYLLDYQPTDLVSTAATYTVKLFGNTHTNITVTYDGTVLAASPNPVVPAVCCEVWAGPSLPVNLSAVTIAPSASMDFKVVQLWATLLGGTINWSFSNTDGTMTGAVSTSDPTTYTVTSTSVGGSATLSVSITGSGWSSGPIPITVQ